MFTNIIRSVIQDNADGLFGDFNDSDKVSYVNGKYKIEFQEMFQNLNTFIKDCLCGGCEIHCEELCGVIMYLWSKVVRLEDVFEPRTFKRIASLIMIDVRQLLLEEENKDE